MFEINSLIYNVDVGLQPSDFPGYSARVQSMNKKNGSLDISLPIIDYNVGGWVYGHIDFMLYGRITSNECRWSFEGVIVAGNDDWDFNPKYGKDKREWHKEYATRAFNKLGPMFGGKDFTIEFAGGRSVVDGGDW